VKLTERLLPHLARVATLLVLFALGALLAVILQRGAGALTWEMVSTPPAGGFYLGGGGGIGNAIVGSLLMAGSATIAAVLLGFPVALLLQQGLLTPRCASGCRLVFDILQGIPSLIYGVFGFTVLLLTGMRASLAAGAATLALLELPLVVRAFDEALRAVPAALPAAARALGASRLQALLAVSCRQALPGFAAGVILAFGRGIGDAAAVLFTAGFSDAVPLAPGDPAATLLVAVFTLASSHIPRVQDRAYAAAAVLLLIVLALSALTRFAAHRLGRYRLP